MPSRGGAIVVSLFYRRGGLIDEIVWSRQLVLVFGNTTQAISAILMPFFGGWRWAWWAAGSRIASACRWMYGLLGWPGVVVFVAQSRSDDRDLYRSVYRVSKGHPCPWPGPCRARGPGAGASHGNDGCAAADATYT
jgi:hypothetical protein